MSTNPLARNTLARRGVGLRTASTVAIWAFGAVVVQQIGLLLSTNVLNSVPKGYGGTAAQQNAFLLFMLPHSIVTISLVTALYTRLSHAAAEGRTRAVKRDLDTGLRLSGLAIIAVMVSTPIPKASSAAAILSGDRPSSRPGIAARLSSPVGSGWTVLTRKNCSR